MPVWHHSRQPEKPGPAAQQCQNLYTIGRAICSVHAAFKSAAAQALRRDAMTLVPGRLQGHFTLHFELELRLTLICSPVSDLRTRESLNTHCRLA